jgi:N utilization substance protein A
MNGELIRIVEALQREKDIDKEVIFRGIEAAVASATKKHYGKDTDIKVVLDRQTGKLTAFENGKPIDPEELGRIAAQSAKQMMIQKIREAESDVIFGDFEARKNTIMTGIVQRYEGGGLIINLGKTEGLIGRKDLIPGDSYRPGDRIRALVIDVRKVGSKVRIILSRTVPEFVVKLFELEVPEMLERLVVVKSIVRNAGYRTKIAIESVDPRIDCVGACVGVRGSRIKNIVGELNGEKIDVIPWDDRPEVLIANALKPAEISGLEIDEESRAARVIVNQDQLSLAIGKRGQNVRLASKLTGWHLDIVTEEERQAVAEALLATLKQVPEIAEDAVKIMSTAGYMSVEDILVRGVETLASLEGISADTAESVIQALKHHMDIGDIKPVAPAVPAREELVAEEGEEPPAAAAMEINKDDGDLGDEPAGGKATDEPAANETTSDEESQEENKK